MMMMAWKDSWATKKKTVDFSILLGWLIGILIVGFLEYPQNWIVKSPNIPFSQPGFVSLLRWNNFRT